MKKISTTQLSKRLGLSTKAAFAKLVEEGFIEKVDDILPRLLLKYGVQAY
jgi:hypothetical protein